MIFNDDGRRKYLTKEERCAFLNASKCFSANIQTLCLVIATTGCRISEAVALTDWSIDAEAEMIVIESLKKRRRGMYRAVPVPTALLRLLRDVHGLGGLKQATPRLLWPWTRITAYRHIHRVMEVAGLRGPQAMPKGLRHGFGVTAIQSGVPLNMVQRWLGHADMRTTAIYTSAVGAEERSIAHRMWRAGALGIPTSEIAG